MKTTLSIGRTTLLLPKNTNPSQLLEMLVGAQVVDAKSYYGPRGEFNADLYVSKQVIEREQERISVSCVPDADIVTPAEWDSLRAATDAKAAELQNQNQTLPKAA